MAKKELTTGMTLKGGAYDGIKVAGKYVTIEGVSVEGKDDALYCNHNCSGLLVKNSKFVSRGKNAVKIIADTVKEPIDGITFIGCVFVGARMAVELQNHKTNETKIKNVVFKDCRFVCGDESGKHYGLSLTGFGLGAKVTNCEYDKRFVVGVEMVGFSDVEFVNCKMAGKDKAFIMSNKRHMSDVYLHDCEVDGDIRFYNCDSCGMYESVVRCPGHVEVKKSENVIINSCKIDSYGHYSIMFDNAWDCMAIDNELHQHGDNYAVVRCYGSKSRGNQIVYNTVTRDGKKGVKYDQKNGAYDNRFEEV